jgi:hypothetical protein
VAGTEAAPARRLIPRGELISAVSALILLILMFAVKWFGVMVRPGPNSIRSATPSAEDAWNGLTLIRWVMVLTVIVALGSVVIHATQRSHGTSTDTSLAVTILGSVTTILLIYRVLIDLPSPRTVVDQKLGAYLGVVAAAGIAFGGYESIQERRALVRETVEPSRTTSSVSDAGTG